MNHFISALTFLTIIPIPKRYKYTSSFEGCERYFPIVGVIIGLLAGLCAYISFLIFPPLVAAAISVLALMVITGGLHIDGLSDTADGFFSYRDKEKTLEIMKDSCIGSMGSISQICLIILKISAIYELAASSYLALFIAPIIGRTAILYLSYKFNPANSNGLGFTINSGVTKLAMNFALALSVVLSYFLFGLFGILAVVFALATTYYLGKISKKKIGGFTGDVLGASCEIAEATTLIILSTSI